MPHLTEQALDSACDADLARTRPWIALTRHEAAVNRAGDAILHGWREPFNLWESVQHQGFRRRYMEGATA